MSKQRASKYLCPRCKQHYLTRDGHRGAKQRWSCVQGGHTKADGRVYCYTTVNPTAPVHGFDDKPKNKKPKQFTRKLDSQIYFITSAQNATPLHEGFYNAITKAFLPDTRAEFVVIPLRYKNATSQWTASQEDQEWWYADDKYLFNRRKKLNSNLTLIGDIPIQPTAVDPLTGLESITHGESGIFGHTKLRMTTVPTPQNKAPKVLTTTGALTMPNYTETKAGKKGEFHHVQGGVVIEIVDQNKFHLHHINCRKDGAFIWLDRAYYPDGRVELAPRYKAIVFGDAHYRFADPAVVEATFGPDGLVDLLDPEIFVWHDLLDCYFGNPHHVGNPFIKKAKHSANFHRAEDEVAETIEWMCNLGRDHKNYIVPSNHDDMLSRWIIREDWKELPPDNMEFYLDTALQMAQSAKMNQLHATNSDKFSFHFHSITNIF